MSLNRHETTSDSTTLEPVDFEKISHYSSYYSMMRVVASKESPVLHPAGTKYLDYYRKIKQGKRLEMDFNDPEAIRHVYKACEEGLLSSDELATAVLLLNASTDFRGENDKAHIKQYRFDDASGPYDYTKIVYAKKSNNEDFKQRLAKLPDHQRYYFEINLPYKSAMVFLLEGYIAKLFEPMLGKFKQILKAYIAMLTIDEAQKAHLIGLVDKGPGSFTCTCRGCSLKPDEFLTSFLEQNHKIKSFLEDRINRNDSERGSMKFMISLLCLAEQHPAVELSSNYDASDPESPLISIILLTMPAFNSLTLAMHGNDATLPDYVVGKIPVNYMRECDEFYSYNKYSQKRPVELVYPGVTSDYKPHDYPANNFIITFHDLFHVWRNGCNPHKNFARYLRQLLEREKGYYMSKRIWNLTDMDYNFGREIRSATSIFSRASIKEDSLQTILQDSFTPRLCGSITPVGINHHNLLIIVDLILNRKKWDLLTDNIGLNELFFNKNSKSKPLYDELYNLIMKDSVKVREGHTSTYYVIKYLLSALCDGETLCDQLNQTDILRWNRNGGLYIQPQYTKDNKKFNIDSVRECDLSDVIHFALDKYNELNFVDVEIENIAARKNLNSVIRVNGKTNDLTRIREGVYRMSLFWVRECFRKIETVRKELAIEDEQVTVPKI